MLQGKKIILGITGSIAAYKAAYLTRLLKKQGAEVKIVITPYGREFITAVTLATLSENTVLTDFFSHDDGAWNSHVDLGLWADVMLVAPATANTIAKMANGVCDNLLLTTYLSVRCPVVIAPAMDFDMYRHPATQNNLSVLKSQGTHIIEPASGELASGLEGKGRMEEPENIISWLEQFFKKKARFTGKRVMITAGPSYEKIDPVRYIGNYSSGKMGLAIAYAFIQQGADVILIAGPGVSADHDAIHTYNTKRGGFAEIIKVKSAVEMYNAATEAFGKVDIAVFAAAVADFRPADPRDYKIKEKNRGFSIDLIPNPDIAMELGKKKRSDQISVGFALETDEGLKSALLKKEAKNFDLIVLNTLQDQGAGFGVDTNQITLIGKDNNPKKYELKSKVDVPILTCWIRKKLARQPIC